MNYCDILPFLCLLILIWITWTQERWAEVWVWDSDHPNTSVFASSIHRTIQELEAILPPSQSLPYSLYSIPSLQTLFKNHFNTSLPTRFVVGQTTQWLRAVDHCLHNDHFYYRGEESPYEAQFSLKLAGMDHSYGYVHRFWGTSITLTSSFLNTHQPIKNWVLVHECSHLRHHSKDYAYTFEKHYASLRGAQSQRNADTITAYLLAVSRRWHRKRWK